MKRIIATLRTTSIQLRLFVTFCLLSVVPLILTGFISLRLYSNSVLEKVSRATEQTIEMVNTTLEVELDKYAGYMNTISVLSIVMEVMRETPPVPFVPSNKLSSLYTVMLKNPMLSSYLRNVEILDRDGNVLYARGYDDIDADTYARLLMNVDEQGPGDVLQYAKTFKSVNTIAIGRKLYDFSSSRDITGYILLYIDQRLVSNVIFPSLSTNDNSQLFYTDLDGTILSASDASLPGSSLYAPWWEPIRQAEADEQSSFIAKADGKDYLVVFSRGSQYQNYAIEVIPYQDLLAGTYTIRNTVMLLVLLMISLCLLVTFIIYRSIMQPIRGIVKYCSNVKTNGLLPMRVEGADEITFLSTTINAMLGEIGLLMEQWKEAEQHKRSLELENLQYQINPHFLFNTLETLKWVSIMNDAPVVTEGIGALSKLFRNTLVVQDEFISLRTEMDNLTAYFHIQRLRYTDCFEVAYDVDDALLDFMIPRFILQPLAENAIIHGTNGMRRIVKILVRSYRQADTVILEIADDGQGFVADAIALRKEKENKVSGIGVQNVTERLRLYYGDAYGLIVKSEVGIGTICKVTLPFKTGKGDDDV